MGALADLERLIGPPTAPPPAVDWPELERVSGLTFPATYKDFANRYGILEIDAFLDVHHVGSPVENAAMLAEARRSLEPLRELMDDLGYIYLEDDFGNETEAPKYPLYPESGGLFPWGSTQNGDTLLWLTNADPDRWTVVVTDSGSWWHFDGGMVQFLAGILDRTVRCPLLPESFPSSRRVSQFSSMAEMVRRS